MPRRGRYLSATTAVAISRATGSGAGSTADAYSGTGATGAGQSAQEKPDVIYRTGGSARRLLGLKALSEQKLPGIPVAGGDDFARHRRTGSLGRGRFFRQAPAKPSADGLTLFLMWLNVRGGLGDSPPVS